MAEEWTVKIKPEAKRKESDTGGLIIALTNGEHEHEMVRVGFTRRLTENPDTPFEEKLNEELVKAEACCEVINDMLDDFDRMEAEKLMKARDRIEQVLGPARRAHAASV